MSDKKSKIGKGIYGPGTVFIMLFSIFLYILICGMALQYSTQLGISPKKLALLNAQAGGFFAICALLATKLSAYLMPIFKPNFNPKQDGYEDYYNDINGLKKICIRILELITTIFSGFGFGSMVGCLIFIGKAMAA